ncbi:hypothetical protein [Cryobacterium sp. Y29]|nr:hypothetical protein [Cryobacterium sp. Y29]
MVFEINIWAGFTAARAVTHDAFDRRPAGLTGSPSPQNGWRVC